LGDGRNRFPTAASLELYSNNGLASGIPFARPFIRSPSIARRGGNFCFAMLEATLTVLGE
jgi:hypothetical protein